MSVGGQSVFEAERRQNTENGSFSMDGSDPSDIEGSSSVADSRWKASAGGVRGGVRGGQRGQRGKQAEPPAWTIGECDLGYPPSGK